MYFKGLGVKTQLLESILLVKKVSDRRDGKSQNLLAYFYYSGLGLEKKC
jgi:TPR repeat protein